MLTKTIFDLSFLKQVQPIISSGGSSVTPESVSGLMYWFRAEDMSFLGEGGLVSTGSASWVDHQTSSISASAYQSGAEPYYTELDLANNLSAIHFNSGGTYDRLKIGTTLISLSGSNSANGTTFMIFFKGNGTDSMLLGNYSVNAQVRRFRSSANNISSYMGATDAYSLNFSSSVTQSAVCSYVYGRTSVDSIDFYEGKYSRGSNTGIPEGLYINEIGDTSYGQQCTGSFAEICIWNRPLIESEIINLYDNYWTVKYAGEPLYDGSY